MGREDPRTHHISFGSPLIPGTVQLLTGQTAQSGGARTGGTSVAPGGDWVRAWRIERAWGVRTVSAASPEGGPARRNLSSRPAGAPGTLASTPRAAGAVGAQLRSPAEGRRPARRGAAGAVENCAAGRGTRAQGARDQKIRGGLEAIGRLIPGRLGEGRQ